MNTPFPSPPVSLPDEFLDRLVAEFDDETVRAIILHGSYARGDARPPYSDVDIVRITQETSECRQQKQFLWWEGYLLNLSSRPLSTYQAWLKQPQQAVLRVLTVLDAQILLDKDGAFHAFQQETQMHWSWEALQDEANAYASQLLVEQTEIILKLLRAIQETNVVMFLDMVIYDLLPNVTEALAVQRGVLVRSGNTYVRQVQETVGTDSAWIRFYLLAAGIAPNETTVLSLQERGMAALHLYRETVSLLQSSLCSEHRKTIESLLYVVEQVLGKPLG
jgi:predicted nucleotidyltransferase